MKGDRTSLLIGRCSIVAALAAFPISGRANDSVAGFAAGGLVLQKSQDIAMLKERLVIAKEHIDVEYVFLNDSKSDIETTVAFPIPEFCYDTDGDVGADLDSENPLRFRVIVDGKEVKATLERHKKELPSEARRCETFTYFWTQKFPKKKPLKVRHEYRPATESTFFGPLPESPLKGAKPDELTAETLGLYAKQRAAFCVDADLDKVLRKPRAMFLLGVVRYILKTGGNWKGPIRDFSLTIEKGDAKNLVSLCRDGLKKIGPSTFEWTARDFDPKDDLTVAFFAPLPPQEPDPEPGK